MTNTEKVLDKVKKLLALADYSANNSSIECDSAMLKAQKLLAEAGLTMGDVIENEDAKAILDTNITEYGQTIWWKKTLAFIIAENFRCISYRSRIHGKSRLMFAGLKSDVEIAKTVFQYASRYCDYSSDMYMLKNPTQVNRAGVKNNYIKGFLAGLDQKFKDQVKANDWGLVLVKDKAVDEYVKTELNLKKSNTTSMIAGSKDMSAKIAGFEAGKNFNVPAGQIAQ